MKKYESKFKDENDKIVFPILIRTIRECGTKFKTSGVDKIIDTCLNSRTSHPSESYFLNISFWPKDLGFFVDNYAALFLSRLINFFREDMLLGIDGGSCFYDSFEAYIGNFRSDDENKIKEIYKAINFIYHKKGRLARTIDIFLERYCDVDFSNIENYKTPYDKL